MKALFAILAICMITYSQAAQGTCAATSNCMGCTESGTDSCTACFNWGSGTKGARQLATTSCATAVANTVADCKYYNGGITATKAASDCLMCNGKDWLNLTMAGTIAVACSNTAGNATTCAATVANCDQSVCSLANSSGTTYSKLCGSCSKGYKGSGTAVSGMYPTCTTSGIITNCDLHAGSSNCYTCASGYAVVTAQTSCTAFTADSNCRKLGTGDTFCQECWAGYYFTATVCTLGAYVMIMSAMTLAVLAFFN